MKFWSHPENPTLSSRLLHSRDACDLPRTEASQNRAWSSTLKRGLCLLALGSTLAASGQSFTIDWHTIDGGGGTSTGGGFSLTGTIGQPDAGGTMTGGGYSLTGGFWVLPFAVQSSGSPLLTITPLAFGQAQISWTPRTPGFVLQQSTNLNTSIWVDAPSGATNPVIVPATLPIQAYRLRKP